MGSKLFQEGETRYISVLTMGHLADEETEAKVIVIKRQNYESSLCFCMHPYSHPDCLPHSDPALHQEKAPGRASPSRRSPMDKRYRTNCK